MKSPQQPNLMQEIAITEKTAAENVGGDIIKKSLTVKMNCIKFL